LHAVSQKRTLHALRRRIQRLKKTLGFPDLSVEMLSFSHWTVNCTYAQEWRIRRCFLLGDAAHKVLPWGALGVNTEFQDAQKLIWKLAHALEDEVKHDKLLDTYESERLELGRCVGLTSFHDMRNHGNIMDAALGLHPGQSAKGNIRLAASFFDSAHPGYAVKRAAVDRAQKALDSEFKAPGYEIGRFHPSVDIDNESGQTHGGQQHPDGSLVAKFYFPSTIPGHHLPHIW